VAITPFCCSVSETIPNFVIQLIVEVKELRDGLPERVLAIHTSPQEILANANFFMVVPLGGLMVLLTKGSVKIKEWNLLKEEFDALVRNGFPLQGSPPVFGWPGLPRLHYRGHG
jgi:hypothetical protein